MNLKQIKPLWLMSYFVLECRHMHLCCLIQFVCLSYVQSDINTVNWSIISKASVAEVLYPAQTSLNLSFICSFSLSFVVSLSFVLHRCQADAKTHIEERGKCFCGGSTTAFCRHCDNGVRTEVIFSCPTVPWISGSPKLALPGLMKTKGERTMWILIKWSSTLCSATHNWSS